MSYMQNITSAVSIVMYLGAMHEMFVLISRLSQAIKLIKR